MFVCVFFRLSMSHNCKKWICFSSFMRKAGLREVKTHAQSYSVKQLSQDFSPFWLSPKLVPLTILKSGNITHGRCLALSKDMRWCLLLSIIIYISIHTNKSAYLITVNSLFLLYFFCKYSLRCLPYAWNKVINTCNFLGIEWTEAQRNQTNNS